MSFIAKKKTRETVPYQKASLFEQEEYTLTTSGRFDPYLIGDKKIRKSQYEELKGYIRKMAEMFSHVLHSAWVMYDKGLEDSAVKAALMALYPVKARVANAAMKQAKTRREALKALKETQITELESKISSYREKINEKVSRHKEWHGTINWQQPPKGACHKNRREKEKIVNMKMKLRKMKQKLQRWKAELESGDFAYCFGSKKLFKAQFFLEDNGFKDHLEWKAAWQKARTTSFFLFGSSDETYGNQLCQLVPSERAKTKDWYTLKLRSGFRGDDTRYCIPMHVPYLSEQLNTNLDKSSVSYHIVLKDHGFYLQPCVSFEKTEPYKPDGALGIDINDGFFSVTETNADGKLVRTEDIVYANDKSTEVNTTELKEALTKIFKKAEKLHYAVAIETINLTKKKTKIQKKWESQYNRMLSRFPYTRYMDSCETLSLKTGVPLYYVSPYWSSVLGDEKYSKPLGISRHQAAAYVIARRALGFGEFYKKPKKSA